MVTTALYEFSSETFEQPQGQIGYYHIKTSGNGYRLTRKEWYAVKSISSQIQECGMYRKRVNIKRRNPETRVEFCGCDSQYATSRANIKQTFCTGKNGLEGPHGQPSRFVTTSAEGERRLST